MILGITAASISKDAITDADVIAHLARLSDTTGNISSAINTLVTGMKGDNVWSALDAFNVPHNNLADSMFNLADTAGTSDLVEYGNVGGRLTINANGAFEIPLGGGTGAASGWDLSYGELTNFAETSAFQGWYGGGSNTKTSWVIRDRIEAFWQLRYQAASIQAYINTGLALNATTALDITMDGLVSMSILGTASTWFDGTTANSKTVSSPDSPTASSPVVLNFGVLEGGGMKTGSIEGDYYAFMIGGHYSLADQAVIKSHIDTYKTTMGIT